MYVRTYITEMYCLFQTVPLMFVNNFTSFIENTRLIMFSNWNPSSEYCSELQDRDIAVLCRAVGIPMPQVDVLVNGNFTEPSIKITQNEVVLITAPISYGEVVIFECQASTETFTSSVIVNLTYTCKCIMIIYCIESVFILVLLYYILYRPESIMLKILFKMHFLTSVYNIRMLLDLRKLSLLAHFVF